MKKVGAILLTILISSQLQAADLYCEGLVEGVLIYDFQGVYLSADWSSLNQRICNLDGNWKGIPVNVCKIWVSSLQTAMYTGKPVKVRYVDSAVNDCAALPGNSLVDAPKSFYFLD